MQQDLDFYNRMTSDDRVYGQILRTLMLMYLTSWEESLVLGLRKKPDRASIYLKACICWKGYDFGHLFQKGKRRNDPLSLLVGGRIASARSKKPRGHLLRVDHRIC